MLEFCRPPLVAQEFSVTGNDSCFFLIQKASTETIRIFERKSFSPKECHLITALYLFVGFQHLPHIVTENSRLQAAALDTYAKKAILKP